ncbi:MULTISPECIES: L,D-transpeptidase [Nocardiopsis]|uniref:Ig-like domain-containing protein n=2 Tax=Nocardiopsis alba TaxID=53437 RepID=A0A7K2ITK1_9ACTN|nr:MULTISPECIES: Ig-like domain-containing protein [Nocardiopsis]AFR08938.1 L,D-transpeptidase catalytic domain protein [Nocardiopsis alba ATCC BAA-2165]MEC3893598.1 Ig-like domain-containing protein [Nocardiopsis sp. LDBS1602]MYR33186.1 L,D-transpeptidase family protein [Nocardiopsis alba]
MTGMTQSAMTRRFGIGLVALALAATACTSNDAETQGTTDSTADPVELSITPGEGGEEIAPNTPVRVNAENGTITDVKIDQVVPDEEGEDSEDADLYEMTGTLNEDGTEWVSDWNLRPGAEIVVTATGENEAGEEDEFAAEFTTLAATPGQSLELVSNFPSSGDTVGVGMPIVINFDLPVANKAQVENSMNVVAEQEISGAWNWVTDQMAVFRPEEYWDPYQQVSVDLNLAGVEASDGVYGVRNYQINFEIGRELIATMHVPDHEMVVEIDGEHERTIEVSNGAANRRFDTTTTGTHVLMERYEQLTMDSSTVGIPSDAPGSYLVDVQYAVRTSNSGEFVHEASYNGNIGSANTSNGCTNLRMDDARWFFDNTLMGDILDTTGTDREFEWDNGWGYWQKSWDEWMEGSVTETPQTTTYGTPGSVHGEDL